MSTPIHRLYAFRGYLGGPMDRAPDGGLVWRKRLKPQLQSIGIIVLDPTNKPIDIAVESIENRKYRDWLKTTGKYHQLAAELDPIRNVDLRMVDVSDFMIIHVDLNIYPCGTMEEMTIGNLQQKPIFIHCEQGKNSAPDWMFAMIPHEYIHSTWEDLMKHICTIHSEEIIMEAQSKRWKFFDYTQLTTIVSPEASYHNAQLFLK